MLNSLCRVSLLGIVLEPDPLAQMDSQLRKRRTLDAIKRILLRESVNQPLMVIFEDLHWIDDETQALLNLLADSIGTVRVLMLVNYRPEYSDQWANKTYYTQLGLDPLGRESAEEMLAALLGNSAELAPLRRIIIEKTEGNPLFMEEIFQALLEDGSLQRNGSVKLLRPVEQLRLPQTVHGILAARIDRLSLGVKDLLQTLAVIGKEFRLAPAREVVNKTDEQLTPMLKHLQLAEFLYEEPAVGDVEYAFKHALTQEVAYNSVLIERRKVLHKRTGKALESLFAERLDDYVQLAYHYERGGDVMKAIEYLERAGTRAAAQAAHSQAADYFTRALALMAKMPGDTDRMRRELDLQMALSASIHVTSGAGAVAREKALVRARELCEQLGESSLLIEVLLSFTTLYGARNQFSEAHRLAKESMALAERSADPRTLGTAHALMALVKFSQGLLTPVHEHFERANELLSSRPLAKLGQVAVAGRSVESFLGLILGILGHPDRALTRHSVAIAAARSRSDPYGLSIALDVCALTELLLRDAAAVDKLAEELLQITSEYGFEIYRSYAMFFRGWVMSLHGRTFEGIDEMRQVLAKPEGTAFQRAPMHVALAEAYAKGGLLKEGLETVDEGLAQPLRNADAELHRVRGELMLLKVRRNEEQAERSLRHAIEIARRQVARFYEPRATVSLARLLRDTNRRDEARTMLAEIYNWFTEGFDTADLKDAKALLDELTR